MCKTKCVKETKKEGKDFQLKDFTRKKKIRHIQSESTGESDQEEYTFVVTDNSDSQSSKITVQVGGVSLKYVDRFRG